MIHFGYAVLIRGSVCMSVLLSVHQERDASSLSVYLCLHQGCTLSPIFFIYPLFHYCIQNDVTSHVSVFALASDSKNPDLYYSIAVAKAVLQSTATTTYTYFEAQLQRLFSVQFSDHLSNTGPFDN